ncbi:NUDIX hydrolase [Patescibacteria group bacterium]|nr:NUDIX hydrolase [Patescibacteria group bacterium]
METFTFIPASSYEGLSPITQAYAVCLNEKNEVLLQKHPDRPWNIAGGQPEPGETYEETAIREVYEETNVRIAAPVMIGYQEVFEAGRLKSYQLRFLASVTAIDERQPDPDEGVMRERLFVPLSEVMKYIPYPQYAELMKAVAAKLELN